MHLYSRNCNLSFFISLSISVLHPFRRSVSLEQLPTYWTSSYWHERIWVKRQSIWYSSGYRWPICLLWSNIYHSRFIQRIFVQVRQLLFHTFLFLLKFVNRNTVCISSDSFVRLFVLFSRSRRLPLFMGRICIVSYAFYANFAHNIDIVDSDSSIMAIYCDQVSCNSVHK